MDQKVIEGETKPKLSRFGRKRLDRSDPHSWADQLEDWFARLNGQVRMVYFMAWLGVFHAILSFIHWLRDPFSG